MKNLGIAFLLGLIGLTLSAQKVIEKSIDYKDQNIEVEVKFASDIEVKTWDRPTVYIKADITTEEGKHLDLYALNIVENDSKIDIRSDAIPIFKAFRKEREKKNPNEKDHYCYNLDYEFNYVLYVPKNAQFKVSSINGNLKSEVVEGEFTADLINGNIDIEKYAGNLDLKTINGEIDLTMLNTSLTAETIHGHIYADEKLKFTSTHKMIGQKIEGATKNATNSLHLSTINGNTYLRL